MKMFAGRIQKVNHPQLLILLSSTEYQQEINSASELFVFLIRYSFLFSNINSTQETCDLKTNHFLVSQENGENGARYLDPKYSRWISTDPALGDYVPQAPVNDEAKKYNENLPGMGGLFNTVNLSLYHYAGNNPVKYVDPDGRSDLDVVIAKVMKDTKPWGLASGVTYDGDKILSYRVFFYTYDENSDTEAYIKNISLKACTHGAIAFRNLWKKDKIKVFESAETLRNSNLITYYTDEKGDRITNPKELFKKLQKGDILIYIPDRNYLIRTNKDPDNPGFSGHTATVIDKGKDYLGDYVLTLEFHTQPANAKGWTKATIQRIYSNTLRNAPDCELYGGASWK